MLTRTETSDDARRRPDCTRTTLVVKWNAVERTIARSRDNVQRRLRNREGEAPAELQPNVEESLRESRCESPTFKTARREPRRPKKDTD